MKKIANILFVVLFTAITAGFTVNKHYSGNELFSVAIFSEPESCCADVCECCDEETETIQFLVDYTITLDNFEPTPGKIELFEAAIAFNFLAPELVIIESIVTDQDLPPPDKLTGLALFQTYLL